MDIDEVSGRSGKNIVIGKKEYHCRDITVGDHIAFLGALKEDQRQGAKRLLLDLKEAGLKDEVIASEYRKELAALKMQSPNLGAEIQTPKGTRYYFWRAVDEKLTLEKVSKLITEENWTLVLTQMNDLFPEPAEKKTEVKPA